MALPELVRRIYMLKTLLGAPTGASKGIPLFSVSLAAWTAVDVCGERTAPLLSPGPETRYREQHSAPLAHLRDGLNAIESLWRCSSLPTVTTPTTWNHVPNFMLPSEVNRDHMIHAHELVPVTVSAPTSELVPFGFPVGHLDNRLSSASCGAIGLIQAVSPRVSLSQYSIDQSNASRMPEAVPVVYFLARHHRVEDRRLGSDWQ